MLAVKYLQYCRFISAYFDNSVLFHRYRSRGRGLGAMDYGAREPAMRLDFWDDVKLICHNSRVVYTYVCIYEVNKKQK